MVLAHEGPFADKEDLTAEQARRAFEGAVCAIQSTGGVMDGKFVVNDAS